MLTKWKRGGNISERLNERCSGAGTQKLEPQGKGRKYRGRAATEKSMKFEKTVDNELMMWYYETPAAIGGVHLVN